MQTMQRAVLDNGLVILRNVSGPTRRGLVGGDPSNEEGIYDFDADDIDPANSARMSFDSMDSGRTRDEDLRLCEYLLKNKHTTPFEMVEIWIEMKLPIFVARQFVRHRTVTINEVSARYVQLPAEWYVPDPRIVGIKPANIKQGRVIAVDAEPTETAGLFCEALDAVCRQSYGHYSQAIQRGIPPELARCFLHLNHYTHWLWKQDLHNMMHFLSLRAHDHAQYEAQQYAYAIIELLEGVLPNSMALFRKYRQQP
jgi:thymidylate synthase (FAD)